MGPLAIGGALLAGGTILKGIGQNEARDAQNDAFQAEQGRQAALFNEAEGLLDKGLLRYTRDAQNRRMTDAGTTRAAVFRGALPVMSRMVPKLPASANRAIAAGYGAAIDRAQADMTGEAERYGRATALPEFMFQNDAASRRDSARQALIASFRKASADANRQEVQSAASEGSGTRGLGDILGGVGGALFTGGLF